MNLSKTKLVLLSSLLFSLNAFAASDLDLKVINKTCDIKALEVTASDKIQIRNGALIEMSQVSEDQNTKCAQAVVYQKVMGSSGKLEDKKSIKEDESAALVLPMKRVVCRNKADSSVISDETKSVQDFSSGSVSISARTDKKTQETSVMLVVKGSSQCPNGNLTIQAQKK